MGENVPFRLDAKAAGEDSGTEVEASELENSSSQLALWKRVFHYAYSLVGNKTEAEDLAQDAFVEIFRAQAAGKPVEWIGAWTRTVTRRLVYRSYREQRPDLHTPLEEVTEEGKFVRREILDTQPSPEQIVIDQDMVRLSAQVLSEFSERDRECVLMYFRGYDYAQIASALGISRWTARRLRLEVIKKVHERMQSARDR